MLRSCFLNSVYFSLLLFLPGKPLLFLVDGDMSCMSSSENLMSCILMCLLFHYYVVDYKTLYSLILISMYTCELLCMGRNYSQFANYCVHILLLVSCRYHLLNLLHVDQIFCCYFSFLLYCLNQRR